MEALSADICVQVLRGVNLIPLDTLDEDEAISAGQVRLRVSAVVV